MLFIFLKIDIIELSELLMLGECVYGENRIYRSRDHGKTNDQKFDEGGI